MSNPTAPPETLPDATGHFGQFGGMFVPETLMSPLQELSAAYEAAKNDPKFHEELDGLLRDYVGRPTPYGSSPRPAPASMAWPPPPSVPASAWSV